MKATAGGEGRWPASVFSAAASLREVDELADLAEIYTPGVAAVTLRRSLAPPVRAEAAAAVGTPGLALLAVVAAPADVLAMPALAALPALAADIAGWVELLAELTGAERVGVRLARLDAAMCPRLHVDQVVVRLVSAYLGPGTDIVPSEEVDRRRLGHAARGVPDAASGILLPGASVRSVPTGHVVLLKGERWPENRGGGAVHRSPAASRTAPRLVLTLDPL